MSPGRHRLEAEKLKSEGAWGRGLQRGYGKKGRELCVVP